MQVIFKLFRFGSWVARARAPRHAGRTTFALAVVLAVSTASYAQLDSELPGRLIGTTATVTEMSSGLSFSARVDTGATSCSIHCEEFEIKDAHDDPKENIGKPVRFLVKNHDGGSEWVESKIADHVTIRTSNREDERYKVPLKLKVDDVEKKVLVTLHDRDNMRYPLLLGRNFLANDFLVRVVAEVEKNQAQE